MYCLLGHEAKCSAWVWLLHPPGIESLTFRLYCSPYPACKACTCTLPSPPAHCTRTAFSLHLYRVLTVLCRLPHFIHTAPVRSAHCAMQASPGQATSTAGTARRWWSPGQGTTTAGTSRRWWRSGTGRRELRRRGQRQRDRTHGTLNTFSSSGRRIVSCGSWAQG